MAAVGDTTAVSGAGPPPAVSAFSVLRVLLILAFVLFLIFAAVWALKKVSPGVAPGSQERAIRIISSTYLGPKKALYLVAVLDRVILVGMTEHSVNALTEFARTEAIECLLEQKPSKAGGGFASILSSFIQKGGK